MERIKLEFSPQQTLYNCRLARLLYNFGAISVKSKDCLLKQRISDHVYKLEWNRTKDQYYTLPVIRLVFLVFIPILQVGSNHVLPGLQIGLGM